VPILIRSEDYSCNEVIESNNNNNNNSSSNINNNSNKDVCRQYLRNNITINGGIIAVARTEEEAVADAFS